MSDRDGSRLHDDALGYSSYQSGASTEAPQIGGGSATAEFSRLTRLVSGNIHKIAQNVSQMNLMIGKIGTAADNPTLRDKLHQVQHYTSQLSKETNKLVKDFAHMPVQGDQSEQRQRKIQRDRLLNDFATVLNNFQTAQRNQKTKEASVIARTTLTTEELNAAQQEDLDLFGAPVQQQQKVIGRGEDVDLDVLQERQAAVQKLEADITDVNQIFRDLSLLVHEQGEVVDSIESHVDSSALHVSRGLSELGQARDYQSKVRRRKLCIAIVVLVIIIVIVIIISVAVSRR